MQAIEFMLQPFPVTLFVDAKLNQTDWKVCLKKKKYSSYNDYIYTLMNLQKSS